MSKERHSDRSANLLDLKRFWDLINFALRTPQDREAVLRRELSKLPPQEILAFHLRYTDREDAACTTDLWGAAYLIQGGCSDDCFIDFCRWLVAQGRRVYDNALANPDSLADILHGEEVVDEGLDGVAWAAWLGVTGLSEEELARECERLRPPWVHPAMTKRWDFDDDEEVRRRFPRLARLYLAQEESEDDGPTLKC